MPVKFGSILHLNNSGSEATLDANNLKGTALQIDDFNSASLAKIGTGLTTAPGKRRLGTIVANTGSINDPVRYYAFINSGSGDVNLSGSEWTTLTNWAQLILDNNTSSFTSTATDGDISGAIDAATGSILNDYGLLSSSIQIADAISGSFLLNTTDEFTGL